MNFLVLHEYNMLISHFNQFPHKKLTRLFRDTHLKAMPNGTEMLVAIERKYFS